MSKFPPLYNKPTETIEIPNFLTELEISRILDSLKDNKSNKATTIDNPQFRKSIVKWIPEDNSNIWVYQKIHNLIHELNSYIWKFELKSWNDQIQYTEYSEEYQGKYDWHQDIGSNLYSHRKLSISIQLSDENEYRGGNLETHTTGNLEDSKVYSKKIGSAIIFPSYIVHRVTPVTKGTRKSLVWWVGGCPFK